MSKRAIVGPTTEQRANCSSIRKNESIPWQSCNTRQNLEQASWNSILYDEHDSMFSFETEDSIWPIESLANIWKSQVSQITAPTYGRKSLTSIHERYSQHDVASLSLDKVESQIKSADQITLYNMQSIVPSPEYFRYPFQNQIDCSESGIVDLSSGSLQDFSSVHISPSLENNVDKFETLGEQISTAPTSMSSQRVLSSKVLLSKSLSVKNLPSKNLSSDNLPIIGQLCTFCKSNGERDEYCATHSVRDSKGVVVCSVLRAYICPLCGATGGNAHTLSYCPLSSKVVKTRHSIHKQCGNGFVRYSHGRKFVG